MKKPVLSTHFKNRQPSAIRLAQIEYLKRQDAVEVINAAIGNVTLPMHPAMQARMFDLGATNSPLKEGVVKYSPTVGLRETNEAFLKVIASSGFGVDGLYSQITDGGSQAMELVVLGVCGEAGKREAPLFMIEAAYTNYNAMTSRLGRRIVSVKRHLEKDGTFSFPPLEEIERMIETEKPGAMVVIPYDNPTGQFFTREMMIFLARLCVKHNLWMISDEAYRELHYVESEPTSIWGLTDEIVSGIEGRRISIETASKVWNACGLRIGALITDNKEFHEKAVAENTANLCANVIGQYIFGALAHESIEDLNAWYSKQRSYYRELLTSFTEGIKKLVPGIIVSRPDASIYSVLDVCDVVKRGFDARDFASWCAREGRVDIEGRPVTLLISPMEEFYRWEKGEENFGRTQMRVAYVETPEKVAIIPTLFSSLLAAYEKQR
jgi:aspartate aminotransferase